MREDEIRRMTQLQAFADFLQKVLPVQTPPTPPPAIANALPPPPPPTTRRLAFGTKTTPEKKKKTNCPPTLDFSGGNIRLYAQVKFRRNQ